MRARSKGDSARSKGDSDSGVGEPGGPKAGMGIDSAYALLIGVGRNKFSDWSLPVAVRDVVALQETLVDPNRCGYHDDPRHLRVLTNEDATRANILQALEDLAEAAARSADATVLVYYSGHGWRQEGGKEERYYLIPHDVKPHELSDSAIPAAEFIDGLRKIRAQRILIMMDTCHAEAMAKSVDEVVPSILAGFRQQAFPEELVARLATGKGRVVFLSCGEDQKSWIVPGDKSLSIFTQHLIEALKGAASDPTDEVIKISHLIDHLSEQVPISARELRREQSPFFRFDGEDFPVAFNGGSGVKSKEGPKSEEQEEPSLAQGLKIQTGKIKSGRNTIIAEHINARKVG